MPDYQNRVCSEGLMTWFKGIHRAQGKARPNSMKDYGSAGDAAAC